MSYNGSGTFVINSAGMPLVPFARNLSATINSLTADLATGLSTAITKDGQTTTTALITFAAGISSTLATDATSISTGSLLTSGGLGVTKAAWIGGLINVAGAATLQSTLGVTGTSTMAAINASGVLGITTNNIYMTQKDSGGTQRAIMGLGNDNNLYIGDLAGFSGGIKFGANGLYAMTLSSAGNVSMTGTLGVTGDSAFGQAIDAGTRLRVKGLDAGAVNYTTYMSNGSGTVVFSVRNDGAVTIPGTLGVTGATTLSAQTTFGERAYLNSTGRISVAGATTIYSIANGGASVGSSATLVLVNGYLVVTPTNSFIDLVLFMPSGTPSVISAINRGSPAARTYTSSGANLQLAMASGTYNVANSNTEQAC